MNNNIDVLIIGAGPAGVAAGIGAKKEGAEHVVVLERDWDLGGILQQCIHPGFGLRTFREELTGPEYMHRFIHSFLFSCPSKAGKGITVLHLDDEQRTRH